MAGRLTRIVVIAVAVACASGCSGVEDAVGGAVDGAVSKAADEATRQAAAKAVGTAVAAVLQRSGIALESAPDCSPDVQVDGLSASGSVDCTATTTTGKAMQARFSGRLSTGSCTGTLRIVVDDKQVANLEDIPACLLAAL